MKLKLILLAGVATATLSGAMIASASADDDTYTSGGQVRIDDETRALNRQALEAARRQDGGSPMSEPADDSDADEASDGQGGPVFQGPPGPDDLGDDDGQADDDQADDGDDMGDDPADAPDGTDDESMPD
jgi:hypothetical protein